ncbi:putative branched-chain-amino-acid aminotransferase IlvE [Peptoclostridium acidaminophilum DSM 3953]|uniref:Putative branched-chain-amino-acid aminotransferase IlvE n=1 Tax=Peptoclostridium acidaminophilum DSM 3953 TaxID=1286171 RepID=W8U6Q8_PEPAC|nr:aminotransferase class IV [Peptoclostridium acidaminophilum]AHM56596.1 putative branched-chain-amino-acid aminotransferase IlvE [Peptoclostridium acidaminophilum DSM 3953]
MNIYLNGEIVESEKLIFSPLSSGAAHGYGVFETIKVMEGRPIFLREHYDRLKKSCIASMITFEMDYERIIQACSDVLRLNAIRRGFLKITCFKGTSGSADIVISTGEKTYDAPRYEEGFRLCYASVPRNEGSALTYIKSTNYMENIMQIKNVSEKGYDEPVFLNGKGVLCEGAISNIFFAREGKVFTPSVECGLLAGIARDKVIMACKDNGIEIVQGVFSRNFFRTADEIFITNSLMGVMPVCQFEGRKYKVRDYYITPKLSRALEAMELTADKDGE